MRRISSTTAMTLSGTHSVAMPTAGIYNLTLAGNCNGGATGSHLKIVEGNGLAGNKVDLALGFEGNPSLAGATTVHLAAGTTLNMVAGHAGADANCGATLGATLVSADAERAHPGRPHARAAAQTATARAWACPAVLTTNRSTPPARHSA